MGGFNRHGGKKGKSSVCYPPVRVTFTKDITGDAKIDNFNKSLSTEEQLSIMKGILESIDTSTEKNLYEFLVLVYYEAEPKHPVKCLLARHITRLTNAHETFKRLLSDLIQSYIQEYDTKDYKKYIWMVSRLAACLDNCPPATQALKLNDINVIQYLTNCLNCCCEVLRLNNILSAEKAEVMKLVHLTLRVLLNVLQKTTPKDQQVIQQFTKIRSVVENLFFEGNISIDSQTVCGILMLSMLNLEGHPVWEDKIPNINIIQAPELVRWRTDDMAMLSLYCGMVTLAPPYPLEDPRAECPLLLLVEKIAELSEGEIESVAATRALAVIASWLGVNGHSELRDALLEYSTPRLDHHVDAVKHSAHQILTDVVHSCVASGHEGLELWMGRLQARGGRGVWWCVARAAGAGAGGAGALRGVLPPHRGLAALTDTALLRPVSSALDAYLTADTADLSAADLYERWVIPILKYLSTESADQPTLDILQKLLVKALDLKPGLLPLVVPHIERIKEVDDDLKCSLMLLTVIQKSKDGKKLDKINPHIDKVLEAAVLHADYETRWAGLGAALGRGRGGAQTILTYVAHTADTHANNPRTTQLIITFLKRIESEYRASLKNGDCCDKLEFIEQMDQLCFYNLMYGANNYRRSLALQILHWIDDMQLEGYQRTWKEDHVQKLLRHLDDNYENNKQLALDILQHCPLHLLQKEVSFTMEDIVEQAMAPRPSASVSAAYKLELLLRRLPGLVPGAPAGECGAPTGQRGALLRYLVGRARSTWGGGVLHLLRRQLRSLPDSVMSEPGWRELINDVLGWAYEALDHTLPLVSETSPEGHVPEVFFGHSLEPTEHPGVFLMAGRPVTAQILLLYAWTTVKEATLIIGESCSRFEVNSKTLEESGRRLVEVVRKARHRAALDHAVDALRLVLSRAERSEAEAWLEAALRDVSDADSTRRGAGLPRLVATLAGAGAEQVGEVLLATPGCVARHALAALLRDASLSAAAHRLLPTALPAALRDLDAPERWCAAQVLAAGVRRAFGPHAPGLRGDPRLGRLPAQAFFSRYPPLRDSLQEHLEQADLSRTSVAGALVVSARLSGAGAELQRSVLRCAASPAQHTRRLAAAATRDILAPTRVIQEVDAALDTLANPKTPRNLCHGLLLRLNALLQLKGASLPSSLDKKLSSTLWILRSNCYPLVTEYADLTALVVERWSDAVPEEMKLKLAEMFEEVVFGIIRGGPGIEMARAACVRTAFIVSPHPSYALLRALEHSTYEVILAALDAMLSSPSDLFCGEKVPFLVKLLRHPYARCRRRALRLLIEKGKAETVAQNLSPSGVDNLSLGAILATLAKAAEEREAALYVRGALQLSTALEGARLALWAAAPSRAYQVRLEAANYLQAPPSYQDLPDDERWEVHASITAAIARLLEGGEEVALAGAGAGAGAVTALTGARPGGAPALRGWAARELELCAMLALLDFGCEPAPEFEDDDFEERVFESSCGAEAEETVWAAECAELLVRGHGGEGPLGPRLLSVLRGREGALRGLCGPHLVPALARLAGDLQPLDAVDPKVNIFCERIEKFDASLHR